MDEYDTRAKVQLERREASILMSIPGRSWGYCNREATLTDQVAVQSRDESIVLLTRCSTPNSLNPEIEPASATRNGRAASYERTLPAGR